MMSLVIRQAMSRHHKLLVLYLKKKPQFLLPVNTGGHEGPLSFSIKLSLGGAIEHPMEMKVPTHLQLNSKSIICLFKPFEIRIVAYINQLMIFKFFFFSPFLMLVFCLILYILCSGSIKMHGFC